jgi:hypothetical protein
VLSPLLLNMLFESSENVPMGKRELVCVVLDDPYRPLPNDDDLSCSKGKSCPNREFDVERFVKLNACDALPEKLCDHNLVLTTKKNILPLLVIGLKSMMAES